MTMHMAIPMARVLRILAIPAVMALLAAAVVGAEKPVGTWADVQKIKAGKAVEVVQGDSTLLRGMLVSVDEDSMILSVAGANRTLARATLRCVAVQYRKTAKGAAIGLLVGLALAVPCGLLQGAGAAAGGIGFYTASGAAIGALNKGYRKVYCITQASPPSP